MANSDSSSQPQKSQEGKTTKSKEASVLLSKPVKILSSTKAATPAISKPIQVTGQGISSSISALKRVKNEGIEYTNALGSIVISPVAKFNHENVQNEEDDLAKSKYMMKSIAGLLTTASVYAGMNIAQSAEDLAEEDKIVKSSETLDLPNAPLEQRKPTLFELSVVPKINNRDVAQRDADDNGIEYEESTKENIKWKLQRKFNLDQDEEFQYGSSAWLLKDVLIQGHVFVTSKHLLFFAYLPKTSGEVKMTGHLNVKAKLKGSNRYWCILKGDIFSLYSSPTEIYFPILTIDLRNVTLIEIQKNSNNTELASNFKLVTEEKTFRFNADSPYSAKTWCNALRRQRFTAENSENNSLSLKIPISNVMEIDDQKMTNESSILRVRALESRETFAVDDYIFMFLDTAGDQLKGKLEGQISELKLNGTKTIYNSDPTAIVNKQQDKLIQANKNSDDNATKNYRKHSSSSPIRYLPLVRKITSKKLLDEPPSAKAEQKSKIQRFRSKSNQLLRRSHNTDDTRIEESIIIESYSTPSALEIQQSPSDTPIPGSYSPSSDDHSTRREKLTEWTSKPFKNVAGMWSAKPTHYDNSWVKFPESKHLFVVKGKELVNANKRFRFHFNLKKEEVLLSSYYAHLNRNVPIYGKLYLGDDVLCFRSLLPGTTTKMVLPLTDIETCYKEKGFRFGYYVLVLVINAYEELFFEFSNEATRNDAESILLERVEKLKVVKIDSATVAENYIETDSENAKLKFFEDKIAAQGFEVPLLVDQNPNFKTTIVPNKSYSFGLLTIGSRGDVQPYIALGQGLIKEGHQVTIITHREFKDFVENHGIKFKELAGDPAELMALMVEHESMNIGMLRDASSRFKGWIKRLLQTSWEACKTSNFDILIESPSAMVGVHIAEALQIPYFRAFTMPWTRTRAYPHAFIVPDQKRGGNYNYLTHVLFENVFWKGISGYINQWRVETLGLNKTNLYLLQQNKVPFLYNISPTIFPPSIDFSEWVKVTGYWFVDEKETYAPTKELESFIKKARNEGKKLIYIGFGSIVVSNAKEMTKALVEAVVEADVYCILNKGWSERLGDKSAKEVEIELPDCVFNAGAVPHDWLFPQLDAAVHHGGSGTTGATLRAGLPTVIKPFFGDQFFYSNRIEDIGVGAALRKLNSKSLANVIKKVLTDERIIEKAKIIQKQIAKENGVRTAINCIYSELEYARSLIASKKANRRMSLPFNFETVTSVAETGVNSATNVVTNMIPSFNVDDSWILL
ncbi:hypothetical protein KAFR_0D00620 [Kazachstania africana CBS 2517]|uniref:Sterol 3-beta-glucosyltransferase n=1 Tax=Kazachstania africana (strain ATCC 22294 / BCRC 22015 / CBS 2517 / CECT 1963 / NBRC 1671 / NRRL Y-8276) TaxID=1071382 RepID=H2ATK9_KAZAF|nr:hypothetical protein KAFR_0D00620 [Kazachstania africana CBS 2517]CCF57709.1 hypothetical protein KAFR_0D00620 [Kazachstania africana CBS 2517]